MKFCTHCGEEVQDDAVFCSKCGASLDSKQKNQSPANSNASQVSSETNTSNTSNANATQLLQPVVSSTMTVTIICVLLLIVGIILLIVGGVQELMFREQYDVSSLSDAGIKWARSLSSYSNSINFLTWGGILTGIGIMGISIVSGVASVLKQGVK